MLFLTRTIRLIIVPAILLGVLVACKAENSAIPVSPTAPIPSISPSAVPSQTPLPPSPTPIPLIATVNGESITLDEFEAELARYIAAQEDISTLDEAESRETVINAMINQSLLAQSARQAGYVVDDQILREHIESLVDQIGGEQVLQEWIQKQGYSQESFEAALRRSIEAAWMRDQILSEVPETAEQVHARQILVYDQEEAGQVLRELQSGKDFASLAAIYDPQTLGDLGWFPRDYLIDPKLDEAAFSLQPEEYSEMIETRVGFHILQVIERDPERVLDPDARLVWQEKAIQAWIETQRSQSEIIILDLET